MYYISNCSCFNIVQNPVTSPEYCNINSSSSISLTSTQYSTSSVDQSTTQSNNGNPSSPSSPLSSPSSPLSSPLSSSSYCKYSSLQNYTVSHFLYYSYIVNDY